MNINGKYLIIRHSIREPIIDAKDSYRQKLTTEGILLANKLGSVLALHSDSFIFFHSPVPRCEQTALAINEGILSNKKQVLSINPMENLAGFFYRNWEYCAELMNKQEFTSKWFDNEIPQESIIPISETAKIMLNSILLNNYENITKIFITHDFNIFCLKSLFRKLYEEVTIPNYLEGIVLTENVNDFWVFEQKHFKF